MSSFEILSKAFAAFSKIGSTLLKDSSHSFFIFKANSLALLQSFSSF